MSGSKLDGAKPDLSLLSPVAINELGKVMTFGKQKYDANNWRKGLSYSRLIAAAMRHLWAFTWGEDRDPESGLSHLTHAFACVMMLIEFFETNRTDLDDRYKHESTSNYAVTVSPPAKPRKTCCGKL